jgi:endonuclease YncB( thermonuclease family)
MTGAGRAMALAARIGRALPTGHSRRISASATATDSYRAIRCQGRLRESSGRIAGMPLYHWLRRVTPVARAAVLAMVAVASAAFAISALEVMTSRALAQTSPANTEFIVAGTAVVVDGRTLDIGSERILLWGIDAPEKGAWCYRNDQRWTIAGESAEALRRCLKGKPIKCRVQRVERRWIKKQYVAECWTHDGHDIGHCMVRGGWATEYTCYTENHYRDVETDAKSRRAGLWQCDNGPPTRRWGGRGFGLPCESPPYKPLGPTSR